MTLLLSSISGIPLIKPGDSIAEIIHKALIQNGIEIDDGDIIVITQKIISKVENRYVNLTQVIASERASELAQITQKDPRFIQLVLDESKSVLRARQGTIIVEHKLGFICANAGIDHSNVYGPWGNTEDWVLLLPENPDDSANQIRTKLAQISGKNLGVMIIDSHGRAWRQGTVGVAIGISFVPGIVDLRGKEDLFGFRLKVTQIAAADELAAAASLVMGQADERTPVIHVRGFPYSLREANFNEILRPKDLDMFR